MKWQESRNTKTYHYIKGQDNDTVTLTNMISHNVFYLLNFRNSKISLFFPISNKMNVSVLSNKIHVVPVNMPDIYVSEKNKINKNHPITQSF